MLNYTLLVANENENTVTTLGPISKLGTGKVRQTIVSNLKANQEYSLKVQVQIRSQLAVSDKHYFRKFIVIYIYCLIS